MNSGDKPLDGAPEAKQPIAADFSAGTPQLCAHDLDAVDVLVEHGFDVPRALAARPDLRERIEAVHRLMAKVDAYPAGEPDSALTDATLARIDRAERARDERMRVAPSRNAGGGSWRLPDFYAVACVALIVVSMGLPLANWLRSRSAESECANNLRSLGGGLARYVGDHETMPYQASLLPDFGSLRSWADARNTRHLRELTGKGYAEERCLCCPNDPAADGYAYQAPNGTALRAWKVGARVPIIADRSPAIELTRQGMPVGICIVNSPDHAGDGQNALFTDGSVEFVRTTTMMIPPIADLPRHLENIYLPMSAKEPGPLEEGLDAPSEWTRLDIFLVN